jgi:DNA-binding response OmpR family regulator
MMTDIDHVTFPDPTERTPTILVVDDEVLIRMVLSDYLQDCGFKVLEAGTVSEAVAIIEASTSTIDLVFSDVNMPGDRDGIALARWVQENRPGLPVLLTSGDEKKAELAGAVCAKEEFLPKPYDHKAAVARVRTLITARKRSL